MPKTDSVAPAQAAAALKPGDHVVLVDGSSFVFRAYHALPPLTRKSDGLPVGAVAGFCNMLWKLLADSHQGVVPTYFAVVFDKSAHTFRNDLYGAYKAHRPEPPDDLRPQFGLIRHATEAFNVPSLEQSGFEADDLIATYAREAAASGASVTIVSSDKDLMQLVGPHVAMLDTMKDKRIGEAEVIERFGVPPGKVVEVQALAGDSVDNVPGVPGIGVKTAAQLIVEYGDVETLLARAGEIKQPKRRESLQIHAEQALLSKRLVTLDDHVPLDVPLADLKVRDRDGQRLIAFCKAMEFSTLTRRVAEALGTDIDSVTPASVPVLFWPPAAAGDAAATPAEGKAPDVGVPSPLVGEGHGEGAKTSGPGTPLPPLGGKSAGAAGGEGGNGATPASAAAFAASAALAVPIDVKAYETVTTLDRLDVWIAEAAEFGRFAVDTETTSLDPMQAGLVGISLATTPGRACYVPLNHTEGTGDLLGGGRVAGQIAEADALARLKPLLEDPAVLKIAQNLKYDYLVFARRGIHVAPFDDTMLLSYALDAGKGGSGMDELSERWLGHKPISFKEVAGAGRAMVTFDHVEIARATEYAAEDADVTFRLWLVLKPRLPSERMVTLYETLERPMVPVLARMEERGITVDRQILSRLSGEFAQKLGGLESEIYELAGEQFNIGSPKQFGDILFGKFSLPGGKKTKTGAWSTGADVLDELAAAGNTLAARILDWRQLAKLKSTYTDLLPGFIHPQTGRVHTSYALASTTTGRLSSSDPNLQNIPVRTEEGRRIRTAFVAERGMKLVSADYSQIELRIVAHVADIGQLKQAFADGLDIHAMTASEMFGVPVEGMPPDVRRRAKAINFGIIYGISAFGLANQLGIPRQEAGDYIARYFERFPGIKDYMETMRRKVRADGFVSTLFGRKIHFDVANVRSPAERAFIDRAAINAPIQGSAADIIRRAMIRMEPALEQAKLSAAMLLQVHDELIFEVPESEVAPTIAVVTRIMEAAAEPVVQLSVPLQVDARAADNWDAAH
jgi:DNA polymerase I